MPKFVIADRFIKALEERGMLPAGTTSVMIRAEIGHIVTLEYTVLGDDEGLGSVVDDIVVTEKPGEAGVAR